jgi:GxxExxY protein
MDPLNQLTERIIGLAIEVHRQIGPGLPESVCEEALCIELREAGLTFSRQVGIPLFYKGHLIGERRPDLIVESKVVVEVKSVERLAPVHHVQLLQYLQITKLQLGLLLNFNEAALKNGIKRVVFQPGIKTL